MIYCGDTQVICTATIDEKVPPFLRGKGEGWVTAEYNIGTGAYNNQNGGLLIKRNPQGATLNYGNSGVDGARGHYARWDAGTAECWVRVAAYNKDQQIKNSWLFGAVGNDQPAEVWRRAGDTFTCNRELFGFSLMNQTNTAAVVGIGGGAVVGAGVGAIAGHGDRAFDCSIEKHREMLTDLLKNDNLIGDINALIDNPNTRLSNVDRIMSQSQCNQVVELYEKFSQGRMTFISGEEQSYRMIITLTCGSDIQACFNEHAKSCAAQGFTTIKQCQDYLSAQQPNCTGDLDACEETFRAQYGLSDTVQIDITDMGTTEYSDGTTPEEIEDLQRVFSNTDLVDLLKNGEESNMGKAIGIGAGVGAGAGGLATAITAFVERSNISCHVGDNLAQVGYNKSYAIESLKDFYVKWNLNLPDIVTPTGTATDCASWRRACNTVTDLEQCASTQITYKPTDGSTVMQIPGACAVSGGVCMENYPVAKSHGACE